MTIYCFTNKSKSFSWWQLANFAQSHRALSCLFHDKWKLFWSPSIIPGTVTLTSLILCSTEQFRTSKPNQNPVLKERRNTKSKIINIQYTKFSMLLLPILCDWEIFKRKYQIQYNNTSSTCFFLPGRSWKGHFWMNESNNSPSKNELFQNNHVFNFITT